MNGQFAIEVKNLDKKIYKKNIIDKLSFTVEKGSVTGFLGPNGSGKTITLSMLTGLIVPDSGNIKIFDKVLDKNHKSCVHIGAIIELPEFYPSLSAEDNLYNLGILTPNIEKKYILQRVYEVLDVLGLKKNKDEKVKNFSLGMKQRLGIAQALLGDPDILILDEPTNGIDLIGLRDLKEIIKYYSKEKQKTFFISSHMVSELEDIFTDLVLIKNGKNLWQGKKNEVYEYNKSLENFFIEAIESDQYITKI